MACSAGCATQDHESYGQCLKEKQLRVAYCASWKGQDYTTQKKFDRDLGAYKAARAQGIQPDTTKRRDVETAVRESNRTGVAFDAGE